MNEVAALREENEILKEEVLQLKAELHGLPDEMFIRRACRLFNCQAIPIRVLQVLVDRGERSRDALLDAIYSDRTDQPGFKIIDVHVCKLRPRIKPFGLTIETIWGWGYRMSDEDRQKTLKLLGMDEIMSGTRWTVGDDGGEA